MSAKVVDIHAAQQRQDAAALIANATDPVSTMTRDETRRARVQLFDPLTGRPAKVLDVLVQLGCCAELLRSPDGAALGQVANGTHIETMPLDSTRFKDWLRGEYRALTGKNCSATQVNDAVANIESIAKADGAECTPWVRVGNDHGDVLVDLGTSDWAMVRVTKRGWTVEPIGTSCAIRKPENNVPMATPAESAFNKLWDYAHVAEEDRVLVAAFLLAVMNPVGPYPLLVVIGQHGAGKSTLLRIIKSLVDPSTAPLRSPPKNTDDLLVGALHTRLLCLDNMSYLSAEVSDALCRLSTGGALNGRRLFTNTEEVLIDVERPVALNSIEELVIRPDLADRAISVQLPPMPKHTSEAALLKAFNADRGRIFAGLLDGVAAAVRNSPKVKESRFRMADFTAWAMAGLPALGFTAAEFKARYTKALAESTDLVIDSSQFGTAVVAFMGHRSKWSGTAITLAGELLRVSGTTSVADLKRWPSTAKAVINQLRRLEPALKQRGISFAYVAPSGNRSPRVVVLERAGEPFKDDGEPARLGY